MSKADQLRAMRERRHIDLPTLRRVVSDLKASSAPPAPVILHPTVAAELRAALSTTAKPKRDRKAYQRDLMRDRRAADKAKKASHVQG